MQISHTAIKITFSLLKKSDLLHHFQDLETSNAIKHLEKSVNTLNEEKIAMVLQQKNIDRIANENLKNALHKITLAQQQNMRKDNVSGIIQGVSYFVSSL